jgi:uncharacterized membrane protein
MPISSTLSIIARVAALVVTGLVAGSVFGIWRGYDLAQYSPAAFIEVHQGAVRGLNTLLPVLGMVATVLVIALAVIERRNRRTMILLLVAAVLLAVAGLVTRLGNQPINDLVMTWTPDTLPANWEAIRDSWRSFHLVRTIASIAALGTLGAALVTAPRSLAQPRHAPLAVTA